MIITCSSCATRFLVDAASIGPAGRQVRCARCQHDWYQPPAPDLPRPAPVNNDAVGAALGAPDHLAPHPHPQPLAQGANLPAIHRPPARLGDWLAWAALIVVAVSLPAGLYGLRDPIMRVWPPAVRLYAALGLAPQAPRLRLVDVSFAQTRQAGVAVLTVRGAIVNDALSEALAPVILVRLRDEQGRDLHQWTYSLPQAALGAGKRAGFETSLSNPPPEARNLDVSFAPPGIAPPKNPPQP